MSLSLQRQSLPVNISLELRKQRRGLAVPRGHQSAGVKTGYSGFWVNPLSFRAGIGLAVILQLENSTHPVEVRQASKRQTSFLPPTIHILQAILAAEAPSKIYVGQIATASMREWIPIPLHPTILSRR